MMIVNVKLLDLDYKINRNGIAAGERRLVPWQRKRQHENRKKHSGAPNPRQV
jgi:hypothetical protein